MSENTALSPLQKKINSAEPAAEQFGMSPAKAARFAVARACEDYAQLQGSLAGYREEDTTVDQIVEDLEQPRMIFLTRGPRGAAGLALFDAQIVAGIIEQITTGRVVPSEAQMRVATRTDSFILAAFLDRFLAALDDSLEELAEVPDTCGYRHLVALEDARAVAMALEDLPYRQLRLSLDLNKGAKTGEVCLIFPSKAKASDDLSVAADQWRADWQENVGKAKATLNAVLHRFDLSMDEVTALKTGQALAIPASAVTRVSIEGCDGNQVATGKMGQSGGHRAVRIDVTDLGPGSGPGDLGGAGNNAGLAAPLPPNSEQSALPGPAASIAAAPVGASVEPAPAGRPEVLADD